MLNRFDDHIAGQGFPWQLELLLPEIVPLGESVGNLTADGAKILDGSGIQEAGRLLCPLEGGAGTGFAEPVLEERLSQVHSEIDLVLTPEGRFVGMIHANNCASKLNAWISLFGELANCLGIEIENSRFYTRLIPLAMSADADAGGLLSYDYVWGEHITHINEGRPLFVRWPNVAFQEQEAWMYALLS